MSVRIRLKKFGTKKRPFYRIVVMEKTAPRDGRTIDEIGDYHPIDAEDKQISFDEVKARAWINKGAMPSDTVRKLFNKKGFYLKKAVADAVEAAEAIDAAEEAADAAESSQAAEATEPAEAANTAEAAN